MIVSLFLLFCFGLCIGSFLGVLICRIPQNKSIVKGRSYCENCKKTLSFIDLIPLLSFFFLKGKCRYCGIRLSLYYPLIELTTGLLFLFTFLHFGIRNPELGIMGILEPLYLFLIISSLIVVFFIDLQHGIIPDVIIFPATVISILYLLIIHNSLFLTHLLSGLGAFLLFYLLFALTKGRGMGFGDVKLTLFMGLFLGFPNILVALYIAFLTGAVISIILIVAGKKKFKGGTIPFGPFLVIGTMLALFWGEKLLSILKLF